MKPKYDKCLNPYCDNKRKVRGLCKTCHRAASKLIAKGKTTWAKLEKAGKILHSNRQSGSQRSLWLLGLSDK